MASSGLAKADSGIQSEPYLSPRSGRFNWYNSGLNNRGSDGYYWSSYTYSKTSSRYLDFVGSGFYPQTGYYKGYGLAVRCFSSTHSFYNLFVTLMGMSEGSGLTNGGAGVQSEPFAFLRSGNFLWDNSGLSGRGSRGYYWSSPTYSKSNSHNLYFSGSFFGPQAGGYKGYGFAVRWVAEKTPAPTVSITYLSR